ncbi:MAG: MATE family efflux transporter [Acinetobacter sp.]
MKKFINLFIPILLSNIAVVLGGVADTIFLSHVSTIDVAAMSVTLSIYALVYILGYGLLQGMMQELAEANGRHALNASQIIIKQGVLMVLLLSVFGIIFLTHSEAVLKLLGADHNLQVLVLDCLFILALALPAQLLLRTFFIVTQTCGQAKLVFYANIFALILKLSLSYALIYGIPSLHIPKLGVKGAVAATLLTQWIMLFVYYGFFLEKKYRIQFSGQFFDFNILKKILRIGFPMAVIILIDVIAVTFISLLSIPLGNTALTAHQIVMGIASLLFMFPSSLSAAYSILISTKVGEGDLQAAWELTQKALKIGAFLAVSIVICVYGFKDFLIPIFTKDTAVTVFVMNLLLIVCIMHIADAMLCILVNMLRCWSVTIIPMFIYTSVILVLGLGGGWYVAYHPVVLQQVHIPALGIYGFWILLTFAYIIAVAICGLCLKYRQYLK